MRLYVLSQGFCEAVWDGVICWDPEPAGQLAVTACPEYITGFHTQVCTYLRVYLCVNIYFVSLLRYWK